MQYLILPSRFSYTECRSFLNMFYEQEEKEVEYIKYRSVNEMYVRKRKLHSMMSEIDPCRYQQIKKMIRERMFDLRVRF